MTGDDGRAADVGFLVALSAVALLFFPWVASPFAPKQELALLLFGAACLAWAWWRPSPTARIESRPAGIALLFVLAAVGSAIGARNAPVAWSSLSLVALGGLLFLLGHLRLWSPAFPRAFAGTVFWTSLPVAALGLAQAALPGRLDFGLQALGKMAAFSTLGNPQFVAAWLVFALPLTPGVASTATSRRARIATLVAAAALALCLVVTRSASGLLALGAAGLVTIALRARAIPPRIFGGLALLIPLAAVYVGLATHSGRGRIMIWTETLLIGSRHPWLGVGLGQYNLYQLEAQHRFFTLGDWTHRFQQNAAFVLDAHNQYLQVLAEQGLVGLGLFVWLIVVVLREARSRAACDPLMRALAAAWCGLLVLFLWNAPLFFAPVLALFWTTAGLLAPSPAPASPPVAASRPSPILRGATVLWTCVAALLFWAALRAGALEKRGDALLETGPFPAAVQSYEAALRWTPQNGYVWEKLALAQYFGGDSATALASLAPARERFGDVGILYLEAEILTRRGDYARAIPRFEFIRDAFPQHVTPSFALGQIYQAQGDSARAAAEFVRVLETPDSPANLKLDRKKIAIQRALAFRFLAELRRK